MSHADQVVSERLRERGLSMPAHWRCVSDNASSESKNNTLVKFMAVQVALGHVNSVTMAQGRVGHTHNRQDAAFSQVAVSLIEPKSWRILNPFGTRFCRPCLVTTLSSCMGQKTFERGCILWVQKWVASIKPLQPPRTTWKPFIAGSWFAETCCRRIGRNKLKRQTGWSIWIRMADMSFFFQSCTWQADPWAKARWCSSRLSMSRSCHGGLKVTPFQGCHSPSGKAKNFSRPQRWWRNGATSVHVNICRPSILDVTFKNSLFLFLLSPYRNSPSLLG